MATLAVRDANNLVVYLDVEGAGTTVDPFLPHQIAQDAQASSFQTAQVLVATQGAIVQLPAAALQVGVLIKALSSNSGLIFLGGSAVNSSNGFELDKNQSILIRIDELSKLYITSTAANEGVCVIGL